MGQLNVLKFLLSRGIDLFRLDGNGESGVHWAARHGRTKVIDYLSHHDLSLSAPNNAGDTPLHLAAKQGHEETIVLLCKHCSNINQTNEEGETALHLAAMRAHTDAVKCLIEAKADPDLKDKHGCTALHLALRRNHISTAMVLLQSRCNIDAIDNLGEAPIHIAARDGLLLIAKTLCAFGCKVEIANNQGQYPLHIAARRGNIEMVRCLCLAGCDVELKNEDGIAAEIAALAHGHNEIAELLDRLRSAQLREEYINQLIPSTQPISRIKLKLFGHSGTGKTSLIESLKCGYFTSWFRRSVGSVSPKITSYKKSDHTCASSIELNSSGGQEIQLTFETHLDTYTRGIDVQQVNISGVGDISIWEFSGHEPYYILYDNFIGNTNCLHLIFYRLVDPYEVQMQQVCFWLTFLQSKVAPQDPLGYCGKSSKAVRVALVATHADVASCHRVGTTGEYVSSEASSLLKSMHLEFDHKLDLCDTVFVMDTHVVGSSSITALKSYISQNKEKFTQGLPKSTPFLDAMCGQLPIWRKSHVTFPAFCWKEFTQLVHSDINPLAGEEHMKEIVQQLQIMGEIIYLSCEADGLVILSPSWFCSTILGYFLSQESIERARVTGIYSADDVQLVFPEADGPKLLLAFGALQLCTECETDGEVEYEFPCFNLVETLDGLWIPSVSQYNVYGGVRLFCRNKHLIPSLFPRLQVYLRRSARDQTDPENDLYQWYRGSKFCSGPLEGIVTLDPSGAGYEFKVRGPSSMRTECFYFMEDLLSVAEQMFSEVCPGLTVERHILSSSQLLAHAQSQEVAAYSPVHIMEVLLKDGVYGVLTNDKTGVKETLLALLFFGATEVLSSISQSDSEPEKASKQTTSLSKLIHSHTTPSLSQLSMATSQRRQSLPKHALHLLNRSQCSYQGNDPSDAEEPCDSPAFLEAQNPTIVFVSHLHASELPVKSRQCLYAVLDPPEAMGRDWCMLGVLLGMTDKLPKLDPGDNPAFSPTASILKEWAKLPNSTIGHLLDKLKELGRVDAVVSLLSTLPFFKIVLPESKHNFGEEST